MLYNIKRPSAALGAGSLKIAGFLEDTGFVKIGLIGREFLGTVLSVIRTVGKIGSILLFSESENSDVWIIGIDGLSSFTWSLSVFGIAGGRATLVG